ncbi:putative beta-lysine N-acetyltransferase [Geovibrio thiophilus]|uniref:Putative beta-lysine N-acetyltransferase n=1 Tax=Geovibrio thiophilus TaxID=139438 RepID=A0A410JVU4_9BACT|nr:putative beta-lysine N-acetyltransferase [Geovibrio thiophilus]QAR32327.1 putative beta-lysine N-acetyltransferase [Geovibrio thiophilus]
MTDKIINLDGAAVHHGKFSDRLYILSFPATCGEETAAKAEELAERNGYSKIIAKVPAEKADIFIQRGYITEAELPLRNAPYEKAVFLSKFIDPARREERDRKLQSEILLKALSYKPDETEPPMTNLCERMAPADADEMAGVYKQVFESYPFPIHDADYIRQTMKESAAYFGIREDCRITALASAEMNPHINAAEMTDFATLPEARGRGYANALLAKMEQEVPKLGISTFFTIARSLSFGMNITFAKRNYSFGGRLINNTNICGGTETMNIWHKFAGC